MYNKAYSSDHGGVCKNVLITEECIYGILEFLVKKGAAQYNYYFTVPVALDEMILMQENLLQGPLDWVDPHLPLALVIYSVPKKSRFSAPTASNGPCSELRAQKALFSGAVESVFTSDGAQIDTKP
jgi:hypothetical protein